jgi:methylmalonyl-CoA mutase, N-terminal domain
VAAIESGFVQNAIAENAYRLELAVEAKDDVIVGVNAFVDEKDATVPILRIDQSGVDQQIRRVSDYKAKQDQLQIEQHLNRVRAGASGTENLLPLMKQAFLDGATLGQVAGALRDVFGEYRAR